MPGLGYNPVSVDRLADGGIELLFNAERMILKHLASETVLGLGPPDRSTILYAFLDPSEIISFYMSMWLVFPNLTSRKIFVILASLARLKNYLFKEF